MVEAVNNFLENNVDIIFLILTGLCIILLVMCISQGIKLSNLSKRVDKFLGSRKERRSLESRLADYSNRMRKLDEKYDQIRLNLLDLNEKMSFCIQKVGLVRYNPFEDMGGEFCFALALLDENDYGVVINTIHGRESSYTYAKSIIGLECKHSLSNEEKAAVMLAVENESRDEVFLQNKNQERRVTIRRKIERKHEEDGGEAGAESKLESKNGIENELKNGAGNESKSESKNESNVKNIDKEPDVENKKDLVSGQEAETNRMGTGEAEAERVKVDRVKTMEQKSMEQKMMEQRVMEQKQTKQREMDQEQAKQRMDEQE